MARNNAVARGAANTASSVVDNLLASFNIKKLSDSQNTGYSDEGSPIYDVVAAFGAITKPILNDLASAVEKHSELRELLKGEGDAAISVSVFNNRDVFSLGVREGKQIYYFGFLHTKDGDPRVEAKMILCEVKLNRDFTIPNEEGTVLRKGQIFYKALPVDYAMSLKKAEPEMAAAA